ncbi:uncharacterized protein LOC108038184 [Drosophila rhopaloa]|uniref:Uncharacterized protein n=1 Tax=Drosophila rhopaloa TaxID=1041015 RepID=A0ABM5GW21_DRORH|nr:uncharacterized protein LOC108038184 [Drosophila rhopaloa]
MDKKTNYKFSERELDIRSDLEFVDSLLKDLRLEAEPQARGVILDLAYTLARDKLVEAQRFAKLANRSNVSVEDLEMADLERTVELRRRPRQQSLKSLLPGQASMPTPGLNHGLLLPTFRHCQVGMTAELKGKGTEPQPRIRLPSNPVAPVPAVLALSSSNSHSMSPTARPAPRSKSRPGGSHSTLLGISSNSPVVASTPGARPRAHPPARAHSTSRAFSGRPGMAFNPGSSPISTTGVLGCIPPVKKQRMQK